MQGPQKQVVSKQLLELSDFFTFNHLSFEMIKKLVATQFAFLLYFLSVKNLVLGIKNNTLSKINFHYFNRTILQNALQLPVFLLL